jgi:hypothetical protein
LAKGKRKGTADKGGLQGQFTIFHVSVSMFQTFNLIHLQSCHLQPPSHWPVATSWQSAIWHSHFTSYTTDHPAPQSPPSAPVPTPQTTMWALGIMYADNWQPSYRIVSYCIVSYHIPSLSFPSHPYPFPC